MNVFDSESLRPAGYLNLISRFDLDTFPNWHTSFVAASGIHRTESDDTRVTDIYSPSYWPGESVGDHLEFALKYDGTNLGILTAVFSAATTDEILSYIESKPLGKYSRRIWFLYEFLTDEALLLKDLTKGNYVDLLESDKYYTLSPAPRVRRQRINNNLPGNRFFCPLIRRTAALERFEEANLASQGKAIVARYSPEMLKRAMSYLYTRETKSSFEIEHIKPTSTRTERFIALLRLAEENDFCSKERLIELQHMTVDPRFCDDDYRDNQTYVGESVSWQQERVHYVCPKPEAVPDLMAGLINAHGAMENAGISPVIRAAAISYGFVFIHPFEDGNGRIHRFLIHNILARSGFSPQGIILPVSAAMLNSPVEYDASLEAFSQSLMSLVEYTLDDTGRMTAKNNFSRYYSYMDMTLQAEALFHFIERTVSTELVEELSFLESYYRTRQQIQDIVDLPDRKIDIFIQCCLQNNGRLSEHKRLSYFDMLTEDEVRRLENAVQTNGVFTRNGT